MVSCHAITVALLVAVAGAPVSHASGEGQAIPPAASSAEFENILEKYKRPSRSFAATSPAAGRADRATPVKDFYLAAKKHPLGDLVLKHFYPESRALEVAIGSGTDDPALAEKLWPLIEEAWLRAKRLGEGGTFEAGKAAANLIRRLAQRTNLHSVSADTGTSPFQDLQLDIQKLPQETSYRISWGLTKLSEFTSPEGVRWTPTAYYQLGPDNVEFIRGFMEVQFASERVVAAPEIAAPPSSRPAAPVNRKH